MNKISKIEKIEEFTGAESTITYGIYSVIFNGVQKVFIRNGNSIGAVSYLLGEPASKCVSEIRDDIKQEFFEKLNSL